MKGQTQGRTHRRIRWDRTKFSICEAVRWPYVKARAAFVVWVTLVAGLFAATPALAQRQVFDRLPVFDRVMERSSAGYVSPRPNGDAGYLSPRPNADAGYRSLRPTQPDPITEALRPKTQPSSDLFDNVVYDGMFSGGDFFRDEYDEPDCSDQTCCEDDCCGPFTFRIGAVFMSRSRPDAVTLVTNNAGAGPVVLSGNDFGFRHEAGIDASVIVDVCELSCDVEFRYLGVNDWSNSLSFTNLMSPRVNTNTPIAFGVGPFPLNASYRASLNSFELNFRRQYRPCVTLLAGFRYIDYDERLDLDFGGGQNFYWMTQNALYGAQFGADAVVYERCCWRIETLGRVGIFGNDAKVTVRVPPDEVGPMSRTSGMDHVAFFGELGLMASYKICPCWHVRGGYQAMWIDGMMLAANQVPRTMPNGVTQTFGYDAVFFHGATVMLEANW
jgi:hypothetical protein